MSSEKKRYVPKSQNIKSSSSPRPVDTRYKTEDVTNTKGNEWEDYFLKRDLLMGIFDKGFEKPSPVQEESIPVILAGQSVIARAKNGTGKTAAFVIPILEKCDIQVNTIQSVILVPTRELALQTSSVVKELGKYLNVECMVSTGGTPLREDIYRFYKTVHILVGTPGRILDLASKEVADLSKASIMVMDEADKLLSQDFQPIIEQLLEYFPKNVQILMYSATFPLHVKDFSMNYLPSAQMINLMDELTLKGLTQYYAFVQEKKKTSIKVSPKLFDIETKNNGTQLGTPQIHK